jgi:tRNA-splicing ligase RtcB
MATNFAIGNRVVIIDAIIESLNEVYPCKCNLIYEISHNLAQMEFEKIIHRKGATRAYPKSIGQHPIIIPGSMGSGAAVLFAEEGAKESLYSINHGAGRVFGRNQAKKAFSQEKVNEYMNNIKQTFAGVEVESILTNTRNVPIDECIDCYKNLDKVLEAVELAGLAKVQKRLFPIAVIKGED